MSQYNVVDKLLVMHYIHAWAAKLGLNDQRVNINLTRCFNT